MAYVECFPYGASIARPGKQQQVFLSRNEWSRLVVRNREITDFMAGLHGPVNGSSKSTADNGLWWCLSEACETAQVRVSLSVFNGAPYCNIRVYVGDTASRQGVTLNQSQWPSVRGALGVDAEADVAREVYTTMLREALLQGVGNSCEGCVQDWCSQSDHACLQEKKSLAIKVLSGRLFIDPFAFQTRLAAKASERRLSLQRPADAYAVCNTLLRQDIEAALLAEQGEDAE
jgi:hypothetical protein